MQSVLHAVGTLGLLSLLCCPLWGKGSPELVKAFDKPGLILLDVSSNSALLLLAERTWKTTPCSNGPNNHGCREPVWRLHVVETGTWQTVDKITTSSVEDEFRQFSFFLPGTEEILIHAAILGKQSQSGTFVWSPRKHRIDRAPHRAPKGFVLSRPSGDGEFLLADMPRVTWNWRTGMVNQLPSELFGDGTWQTNPAAREVLVRPDGCSLSLYSFESQSTRLVLRDPECRIGQFRLSSDGKKVVAVLTRGEMRVVVADLDGVVLFEKTLDLPGLPVQHPGLSMAVSPDGSLLAISFTEQEQTPLRLIGMARTHAAFAVFRLADGELQHVFRHPGLVNSIIGAKLSPAAMGALQFSSDGQRLFTSSGDTRIWRLNHPHGRARYPK